MDCHIIQSTRFTITGLCLAMSLQGCLSNDLSSKANSAPLRQVHPQVHTYDHALAEMGKQVPGFGGMYVDASGNLIVYLKQGQLEKAVAIPDVAQAALRSALEKVFGADTSRHVSVPHNGKPVTTNPQIQFIAGNYSITELNGWYPDVQLALDIPEVLFTDIDEAKNRITIGIQNESARQAVHTALANSGIPARALNIEVLAPTTSQANLRQTIRPSHGGMRISVFHEDLNPGAFPMYCSIGFNATHSQWGNGFVTNAHCGKTMGVVDPYEVHQYAIDGGRVTDQSFIGWELVDPTFWRSPYPWVCPAFSRCRYSDAVFVGNYGFEPTTLGKLARPALKNHVSHLDVFIEDAAMQIDTANPTIDITGEKLTIRVGDYVNKIGSRTGWTIGKVSRTCINKRQWIDENTKTDIVLKCQNEFTRVNDSYMVSAGGDSGSPVFAYFEDYNGGDILSFAHLVGLLHSGDIDGNVSVFSSLTHVKKELDLIATH